MYGTIHILYGIYDIICTFTITIEGRTLPRQHLYVGSIFMFFTYTNSGLFHKIARI